MVGEVFLHRYVVLSLLGKGSMGTVFLARDQREPRTVVVKVIHPEVTRDPSFKQLFEQEIDSLTHLRHPCAVGLLDASFHERHGPCLVMEFIPGITLEDLLQRHRRLSIAQTGRLLLPICRALDAGHAQSIVHRDIKPANMMVVNADSETETVKVMDFGLALINRRPHISLDKLRGSNETVVCGTPVYMAPESTRGDPVDHRADVYSLGVLIFEMLLGKPPFYFATADEIIKAHVNVPPPRFTHALPGHGVPSKIEDIVQHCLGKFPNERPQSAREVAQRYFEGLGQALPESVHWQSKPQDRGGSSQKSMDRSTLSKNPHAVIEQFDAWMPEAIAVVKLRGFVHDAGGRVVESEPGRIRVQLGEDPKVPKPDLTESALMRWFAGGRPQDSQRIADPEKEPIDLLLYLERKNSPLQNTLNITVVMKPLHANRLIALNKWKARCEKFLTELRAYLIAN
ncbi:MAG TPA: serine/threonine-protein kinase [Gemmataceae bacterium]|jgi:serine/threonine protein kinase|nr:serine/threonine-protein kinase [Gemmataceae bacterium]